MSSTQPSIIIVTGGTGAGKTSYARSVADELGALRFSIDDWMATLFWMDSPKPIQFEWTMARIERCEAMIWTMAQQALGRGVPVILDLGFATRDHRRKFQTLAEQVGYDCAVHLIDVAPYERWRRVEQRNAERGATYALSVDRTMFDFMETLWERPDADELRTGRIIG